MREERPYYFSREELWSVRGLWYKLYRIIMGLTDAIFRRDKNPVIQRALRVLEESKCRKIVAPKEILVIRADTNR